MEACRLTVRGEEADRFAEAFVDAKATESERSINKRGVRNVHRYDGDGFTQVVYERAAAHTRSWLQVTVLVETHADDACTVAVFVGGGGEGPFKLEEISARRVLRGEDAVGQAGRYGTVLRDIRNVAESLGLEVVTAWESGGPATLSETVEGKLFDS